MSAMFRAFTRQGLTPCCSRTSYTGIQYTPVDSIATVVTPQLTGHRAISFRSSVNVGKTRTGFSSRSAGTATKISRAPMSIPPAFGSRSGRSSSVIPFFRRLPWPAAAFFFTATFRRFGGVDIAYPFPLRLPLRLPLRPGQVAQNESTLLIGISLNAAQTVTTVMAHGTWDHACRRV